MLAGLAYLLLLVVGGVAVVSGAVFGGLMLQFFTWLTADFPNTRFRLALATRPRPRRYRDRATAVRCHPHCQRRLPRAARRQARPPVRATGTAVHGRAANRRARPQETLRNEDNRERCAGDVGLCGNMLC